MPDSPYLDPSAVFERFDRGRVVDCSCISTHFPVATFKITTESESFCLKRHRPEKTIEQLEQELDLHNRLRDCGFELPPPVVQTAGGSLYTEYRGSRWSLCEFIESDSPFDWTDPTWTPDHCFAAGSTLAKLHFHGQSILEQHRRNGSGCGLESIVPALPAYMQIGIEALPYCREDIPSCWERDGAWLYSKASALSARIVSSEEHQGVEPVLVHGDYHPGNLLFRDKKVAAVLDFEYAHFESPLFDLGYAALFFCSRKNPESAIDNQLLQYSPFESLVNGYLKSAVEIGLQPKLTSLLGTSGSNQALLLPYIELGCFLTVNWILQQLSNQPELKGTELVQQLERFHCLMSRLQN